MNYWNKDKKSSNFAQKKTYNWNQSLKPTSGKSSRPKKLKSLQYLLILKKFDNVIDYKNIKLLKAFNEIWKIRPRRKTRISVQKQHAVAKAIVNHVLRVNSIYM
jgi:ribosomal protein S18